LESQVASYKLIKAVKDDKFDIDHLDHYTLLLSIGTRDVQVGIVDSRTSRCMLVEDYILPNVSSYSDLFDCLTQIFDDHHTITAGFWKAVKVSIKNNKFAHIPAPLFEPRNLPSYLQLNADVPSKKENNLYYKQINSDAVTVFSINKILNKWIDSKYPTINVQIVHQSSALIESILKLNPKNTENSLFVYIDRFKLHLISIKEGILEYYNQFPIKQFSDYVKYIMLVLKGLKKDQQNSNIVLWGYLGKQSPHYKEFSKYIRNISFGDRPKFLKYSYLFDEIQDHHFLDLYGIYLCE